MEDNSTNTNVNENNIDTATNGEQGQETKTYTEDEVMKLITSESDKRVTQALKTAERKWKKEMSLAQLDDEAREKAMKDNKIAELEAQLEEFTIEKNRSELKSVLSSRGLSAEFADIIHITDDVEANQESIDRLDKLFKLAVKTEVEKRLTGTTPKGNGTSNHPMSKAEFLKLPLSEMQNLINSNPEYYNGLLK